MNILEIHPYVRFQYNYNGHYTVIEGAEFDILIRRSLRYMRHFQKKGEEFMSALLLGTISSYMKTYSIDILEENLLKELVHPDARKLDLLYRGLLTAFATAAYPVENWNKIFGKKNSTLDDINKILYLKPNFMGIGININNIIDMLSAGFKKKNNKHNVK